MLSLLTATLGFGSSPLTDPLQVPAFQAAVLAAAPKGLKEETPGRRLSSGETPVELIKNKLFTCVSDDDAIGKCFSDRLGFIDGRVAKIMEHAATLDCLNREPRLWTPSKLPGNAEFPMYFQCRQLGDDRDPLLLRHRMLL